MNKNKIYSLVVKDEKNQVEGIIRMHDIVEAKIFDEQKIRKVFEKADICVNLIVILF